MNTIDEKALKLLAMMGSANINEAQNAFAILHKSVAENPSSWMDVVNRLKNENSQGAFSTAQNTSGSYYNGPNSSEEDLAFEQARKEAFEQSCKRRNINESTIFHCSHHNDAWLLSDDPIAIERRRVAEETRRQWEEMRQQREKAKHTASEPERISKAEQKRREKEARDRLTKIEAAKARGKRIGQREASELAKDLDETPLLKLAISIFQNRAKLCPTDREAIEKIYSQVAGRRYGRSEQRAFRKAITSDDAATIERLSDCLRQTQSTRIY